ncbi:MAG: hypothetical protein E4G96_04480 [Chrysiogenales bacterium]|nr:MAG: hypothetical protein E4G96_04480 [Chrysiogenales bacterium]
MDKFLFMKPVLRLISDGNFFKNVFAWFLKILGILTAAGFLGVSYQMWKGAGDAPGRMIAGMIIIQLFIIVLGYIIVHLFFIRSSDVDSLPDAGDYKVIPLVVIASKLFGEILAAFFSVLGIAGGLAVWIGGPMLGGVLRQIPMLGGMSGGHVAIAGITMIIMGALYGYLFLMLFYFLAEQIGVLVDISRNTKR